MYASDEDWKKDLDEIDKILDEIGKMEGKVAACAQNLLFVLERAAKAEEKLDYDFNYDAVYEWMGCDKEDPDIAKTGCG